jgi:hypothetical protein
VRRAVLVLAILVAIRPGFADAQAVGEPAPHPNEQAAVATVKFLSGAAAALAMHEGGHLVFDAAFDAQPTVTRVHLGAIPFFAIAHRGDLSNRREFVISSAGFWVQEATNEWLLAHSPPVRQRGAFVKGVFAFNVLTSIGYAAVAFAHAGPPERDTRGIATSIGVDERVVAAFVLAPAVLDGVRYFNGNVAWARWASRAAKAASVLLVVKGGPAHGPA